MQLGVMFNHADIGNDPSVIRDYVQALDDAGFHSLSAPEHVVGGHPDRLGGQKVHTYDVPYHEPFVLFGFIAAVTSRLELVTSILVLPQRQTVLVAKQAAQLDLLCGGRLRLGVGVGRNWMEYEALNEEFSNRGSRLEEQVQVLRMLWTEELVTFEGKWHHLDRVGLNPGPVQRPIPIWMGSYFGAVVERVIRRTATMADGWMPQFPPNAEFAELLERFKGYAREAGRDPAAIGIECSMTIKSADDPDEWAATAKAYRNLGATHLKVNATRGGGFASPQELLDAVLRWRAVVTSAI